MDYSNIPTGLKITTQIPLNVKEFCKDEDTLAYLGVDDNLAFTYHDQLEVLCLAEKSIYIWREVQVGEENTGLVPLDFTYPLNLPETYGINYSGKKYNFFLTEYITVENINENINIINVGEGLEVYKGYNTTSNEHEFRTVVTENLGTGKSFLKDIQQNTDELKVRVKTLVSDNLTITEDEENNTIKINSPVSTSNLSFYVDVNSISDTETGLLSSPFKTLNKALDSFIGTGTWYNPQYKGYNITLLSTCALLEAAGVDYNGYVNLDINNLNIEGNGFYLGLYSNPSPDYYPLSTRRMVSAMPKTAGVLDFGIDLRFNNEAYIGSRENTGLI